MPSIVGTVYPGNTMCMQFFERTLAYWRRWVKHCNVPPMFQREIIRSALVLKLHCFEDTERSSPQ